MAHRGHKQLIMLEEQTVLSRERTMQQYINTGLAFIGLGLIVTRFFSEGAYQGVGAILIILGFWQIYAAYTRFQKYRKVARKLRKEEKKFGLEVGE
jgi:uncharacterized membrane protein YidH (DUF202 family)